MIPCLEPASGGVVIRLLVQPRASRSQLAGLVGDELKVRLTSPPVDGAANLHCIKFFAKLLGVSRSELELVAGETSRHKRLLVRGASPGSLHELISRHL